ILERLHARCRDRFRLVGRVPLLSLLGVHGISCSVNENPCVGDPQNNSTSPDWLRPFVALNAYAEKRPCLFQLPNCLPTSFLRVYTDGRRHGGGSCAVPFTRFHAACSAYEPNGLGSHA